MGRPGITEAEVIEAIEALLDLEAKITVESIRLQLQRGSPNTINRHLRAWKTQQEKNKYNHNAPQLIKIKQQNFVLKSEFKQQQQQLQTLTEQLLNRDRKIVQLEKELQQTQLEITKITAANEVLLTEREKLLDPLLENQKTQVAQFSQDLQAINKESLQRVREIGMLGQELLLAEKLKVRDLTAEIKNLHEQIKQLQQTVEQTKNSQSPLQNRLKQQEQLISNCLDPNKVEQFNQQVEESNVY